MGTLPVVGAIRRSASCPPVRMIMNNDWVRDPPYACEGTGDARDWGGCCLPGWVDSRKTLANFLDHTS